MSSKILPSTFRKLVVTKLTNNFREAVAVKELEMVKPGAGEILIRNRFVGINASDVNFSAGAYDPTKKPPFDCGFEGLGEVVAVGEDAKLPVGQTVMYMVFKAFSEYLVLPADKVFPVPSANAEFIPLLISGLTASIGLDQVGRMKSGENVLVTAAAGGTGQFAVQWAKKADCKVIGTCSSDDKVEFLKSLGCDRPINYKKENVKDVLKSEFPNGVDVVYESVGGEMFETCVNSLAIKGRLVIIGYISQYTSEKKPLEVKPDLPRKLLTKSANIGGFFMPHYSNLIPEYVKKLVTLKMKGEIVSCVDQGINVPSKFVGIDKLIDAVEYMYSGKSQGKVVVELNPPS